jgi:hypothetical protein
MGRMEGTLLAVRVSSVFAWILGGLGLLSPNLMLALVALFLWRSAKAEELALSTRALLGDVRLGQIARRLEPLDDRAPIEEAARHMAIQGTQVLPVALADGSTAVIRQEQIRRVPRAHWQTIQVRDVRDIDPVKMLDAQAPVLENLQTLAESRDQALPVADENGRVIGITRLEDLAA